MPEYEGNWYGVKQFDFDLAISLVYNKDKTYNVKGYIDGKMILDSQELVSKNSTKNITYNTGELTNGDHELVLKIYDGAELIYTINKSFSVMKDYEHQFMEEYSGKGFNHHLRLSSRLEEDIAAMKRIGSMALRDAAQWNSMEKIKKQIDFESTDAWMEPALELPGKFLWVFAFNNNLYSGFWDKGNSEKWAATSKEVYDNYADYTIKVLEHYPEIDYAMLWNEPVGAGFWMPQVDIPSYAYLATVGGAYIKEYIEESGSDVKITAGSAAPNYAKKLAETGGYPFIDCWMGTYYSTNPTVEFGARRIHEEYIKRGFGGWKGFASYEFGYPTNVGMYTEEEEAKNLVIQYIMQDSLRYEFQSVYQFNDFGTSKTDREQNYGVVKNNGAPKPALYSVATFYSRLNGAKYLGKIQNDDFEFHIYYKDGEPIGVVWSKDGIKEFKLEGQSYSAFDLNDTRINVTDGSFMADGRPAYLIGLSDEWIVESIRDSVMDETELMLDYYANLLGDEPEFNSREERFESIDADGGSRFNEELYNELINVVEEGACGYPLIREKVMAKIDEFNALTADGMPTEAELKEFISSYYDMGTELMQLYKDEEIKMSMREFSGFMFSLHWIGQYFADLYMTAVPSDQTTQISALKNLESLEKSMKAEEDKYAGGLYEFSESMLNYAMDYAKEADSVSKITESNPQKAGVIASRELLASELSDWVKEFITVEGISGGNVFLQMTRVNRTFYNFAENEAVFSLYNFSDKDFKGEIKFYDSEQNELFTAPAEVGAGSTVEVKHRFNLENTTDDRQLYTVRLVSNDMVYYEEVIDDIELGELCAVSMNTVTDSFDTLDSVSFDVENTFNAEINVTLKVTPPEGWTLEQDEIEVSVAPGAVKTVEFGVTNKSRTDFNEYYFDVDVMQGDTAIARFEDTPLQFTYVPRAASEIDTESFTGDISAWKNAYPVMVNVPENPSDPESWNNANAALRAYAQWDSNYLYVLVRVNDDKHLNSQAPGANIWNGDNIQISIDGDNSKDTQYGSGDYEYGFSLLDSGQANYAWTGANDAFNNMDYKIVRDDNTATTTYLLKFPQEAVAPLKLTSGSEFGMNFVLNECDYISRDYYYELTEGTAKAKSPIYYHTWVLGN